MDTKPIPPEPAPITDTATTLLGRAKTRRRLVTVGLILVVVLAAISTFVFSARLKQPPVQANPTSTPSALPTPASAKLSAGKTPAIGFTLPSGFTARVFADGLTPARDLVISPGGTLFVSSPKAGTVTALPDVDHNGVADSQKPVITGATLPHGLAFHGGKLFVAETGRLSRYLWDEAGQRATFEKTIATFSTTSGHTSRTLSIAEDGTVYVTIGSTCNVCRETNATAATMLVTDINGTNPRTFASGLRNAAFSAIHPTTGELWATENSRDNLGDNLPPDEINIVKAGKNYGWPLCYGARVHDTAFDKNKYVADPCAATEPPLFAVPAHNAPLGLSFIKSAQFDAAQQGDLLVAYHGSWNRSVPDGYKVARLHVEGGRITSSQDFMTGFIQGRSVAGRPVDVTFDTLGNLYVSDDQAGAVYIVQRIK